LLIIIEGADGSGKTHLAERLIDRITAAQPDTPRPEYIHKKRPTESSLLAEYLRPIADYRPRSGRTLILDRWHLGELVYPEMTDRQTLATAAEFTYLEMFLRSRGALVVHVDTGTTTILEAIERRPDADPLEERVLEQHAGFSRAIMSTNLRTVTYDRRLDVGTPEQLDLIISRAIIAELDTPMLDLNPTYVGPTSPSVVLVGDRRNVREDGFPYPTAFVPEPATSGRFLIEALPMTWRRYGSVGFINANEGHPIDIFSGSVVRPNFVVLGREAEKTIRGGGELAEHGFGVVPHPQYIRRFHHHARDGYGMEIQRAALSGEDKSTWRP
jgi:thymidylate kinase